VADERREVSPLDVAAMLNQPPGGEVPIHEEPLKEIVLVGTSAGNGEFFLQEPSSPRERRRL